MGLLSPMAMLHIQMTAKPLSRCVVYIRHCLKAVSRLSIIVIGS